MFTSLDVWTDAQKQAKWFYKGQTIRKLMGGGTAGEVPKKYSRKGKLNKKIHARQLILKNIHAMA